MFAGRQAIRSPKAGLSTASTSSSNSGSSTEYVPMLTVQGGSDQAMPARMCQNGSSHAALHHAHRGPRPCQAYKALSSIPQTAVLLVLALTLGSSAILTASAATTGSTSAGSVRGLDFYAQLVSTPARLTKNLTKAGPIPYYLWDDNIFSFDPFHHWLVNTTVHRQQVPRNYPLSYPCGVWVNHHYKFIFIRNRKAASTTVTDQFNKCSYKVANPLLCIEEASMSQFAARGLDHAAAWKDYFVFSTARNPWARAGSSYDYCSEKWLVRSGPCKQPPFLHYCKDPSLLGKISNLFRCYDHVAMYHDFYHTEPVASCLTTQEGLPAVDYLVRYEHLEDDVVEALRIINERRDPKLPPLPPPTFRWKKKGKAAQSALASGVDSSKAALVGHAGKYRACGMACVEAIGSYFKQDVELFGISVPDRD